MLRKNETVDGLRFVCNVLVAVFHAGMFPGAVMPCGEKEALCIISDCAWWLSIPMLFLISGWCFFNGFERVSAEWWLGKLRNRIWRLLVPFLVWGAVFTALYCALGNVSPRVAERLAERQVTGWQGYVGAVFNARDYILYGPLWFLRALFACAIAAPLVGFVIAVTRRKLWLSVIGCMVICGSGFALGACMELGGFMQYPGYGFACFGLGAWLAANGQRLSSVGRCLGNSVFARLGRNERARNWLLPTGMLVYIVHLFVNRIVQYSLFKYVGETPGQLTGLYLLSLILSVLIPIGLWHCMNYLCPRALAVLDGRGLEGKGGR